MTEPRTLADDVRLLGDTLGHVLEAHGGRALFDAVESLRLAAKQARDEAGGDAETARARLGALAAELDDAMALDVIRAFTLYFQLVNLAEDQQRARELRRREIATPETPVSESLAAVVEELHRRGASLAEVLDALREVRVGFVFTAHPTEARRRTTERLLASVRATLESRDGRALTPTELRGADRRLRAAIEALWEHAAERTERPEVLDEVKAGLWYLENVLLDQVPRLHRRIAHALERRFGPVDVASIPDCVAFGSWMGGDRDGNPYVTDAITERTLELHRGIILSRYEADVLALIDPLSGTESRLGEHPALTRALARAKAAVPEIALETERRNRDEPLRRMLTFIGERLRRTRTFSSGAYHTKEELVDDLLVLREALSSARATGLADDELLSLIFRVRSFGFTLANLDLREDSRVHRAVVAELSGRADFADLDEPAKQGVLRSLALPDRGAELSDLATRLLDSFRTVARMNARFGADALRTYIISMTEAPSDVLTVLRLAQLHQIDDALDIVPLLETPDDLARAETLLDALFRDPTYRAHLARRGDVQEFLVGYSDSMKQGGILASRVRVSDAQRAAARVCAHHGVTLRVFHGRGGSISRGGGPTYRAIRALPREAFSGRMKITEQGEMRAYNFANPPLAARYIEQTVGAALLARWEAKHALPPRPAGEAEMLEKLASSSRDAYRELVEDPDLVTYYREATPFASIAALNIASRPAKRKSGALRLEDLRAIPWVFAWSQSRQMLTGWYGVGAALASLDVEERVSFARLYRESPFVRDLIDNVEMVLAKSDLAIAERYSKLTADPSLGARMFDKLRAEYARTVREVFAVVGRRALLEDDEVLAKSIRLRNPYVDPLSYLQVEALRRGRAADEDDARTQAERVARVAVQGIAAGLRYTG